MNLFSAVMRDNKYDAKKKCCKNKLFLPKGIIKIVLGIFFSMRSLISHHSFRDSNLTASLVASNPTYNDDAPICAK